MTIEMDFVPKSHSLFIQSSEVTVVHGFIFYPLLTLLKKCYGDHVSDGTNVSSCSVMKE